MLKFKEMFSEAIKLSTYRDALHISPKKGSKRKPMDGYYTGSGHSGYKGDIYGRTYAKNIVANYKEHYEDWFGTDEKGKPIYRIVLPLDEVSLLEKEVNKVLEKYGYKVSDWKLGLAYNAEQKRTTRIGKLLLKNNHNNLLGYFNERFGGKLAAENTPYQIVISRHPYDILGQSHDREWESCKNLTTTTGHGSNRHYLPLEINAGCLVAYVVKTDAPIEKTEKISSHIIRQLYDMLNGYNIGETKLGGYRFLFDKEFHLNQFEKFYQAMIEGNFNFNDIKKEFTWDAFDDIEKKLNQIRRNNSNDILKNPISRLLIIPYYNEADSDDNFLVAADSVYGKQVSGFQDTVQAWLDEKQGAKYGVYTFDADTFYDDDKKPIINTVSVDSLSGKSFDTFSKQRAIITMMETLDLDDKEIVKRKYNQYLMSVEDINKIEWHFYSIYWRCLLPTTIEHLYNKYVEYLTRPIEMENHIYFYETLTHQIEFAKCINTLVNGGNNIFSDDGTLSSQYNTLMELLKKAITEQQMTRKQVIVVGSYSSVLNDVIVHNNDILQEHDINETITLNAKIMVPRYLRAPINKVYTWEAATQLVYEMVYAGYHDWRLPTVEELFLIYMRREKLEYVDTKMVCWSGEIVRNKIKDRSWAVEMSSGHDEEMFITKNLNIIPVRDRS
jgi:hypothetical protein